jgi:hypothetical protein
MVVRSEFRHDQPKVKKFEVAQLLTDLTLTTLFSIDKAMLARMRNLAIVDTRKAAEKMQDYVRTFEGYERAEVEPGRYLRSWKWARDSVKQHAGRFPILSVAYDALLIGDKLFLYGTEDKLGWYVCGPVSCAALVQAVHRMVAAAGCPSTVFALGMELTLLDIDVFDGVDIVSPLRECHAGNHRDLPVGSSLLTASSLSTAGRAALEAVATALLTVWENGEAVATAVRVGPRYVVLNSHVLEEHPKLNVDGQSVSPVRMLARDLWLARTEEVSFDGWLVRDPRPGEQVVLCYKRFNTMQYSDPVELLTSDGDVLTFQRDACMVPGVSGAAVVALRDFALLGVYDGVGLQKAVGSAFTPAMFVDVCAEEERHNNGHESAADGETTVYGKLKRRGLAKALDAVSASLVPLYNGPFHVGVAVAAGGYLRTTCDPDLAPLSPGKGETPLVFERVGPLFEAPFPGGSGLGPAHWRRPNYGERVFVVGVDDEGPYYSHTAARVVHVGVSAKFFQVVGLDEDRALPLVGGLVVAESDAAVLGHYAGARFSAAHGQVGQCEAYQTAPLVQGVPIAAEEALMEVFPFLRPKSWAAGLAEECLVHSSAQAYPDGRAFNSGFTPLAGIGDAALATVAKVRMREQQVPTALWQSYLKEDQSNAAMVRKSESLGLVRLLRAGVGFDLKAGSKVAADLLEAVAGGVYLSEASSVFETFAEAIGALRVRYDGSLEGFPQDPGLGVG